MANCQTLLLRWPAMKRLLIAGILTVTLAAAGVTGYLLHPSGSTAQATVAPAIPQTAPTTPQTAPQATVTAESLATHLRASGLPMAGYVAYTAASDPNHLLGRQNEYTSKINWSGGSIEVFPTADEAQTRITYLKSFGPPLGDGYDYISGSAVLRLFTALTPSQAKEYETAFTQ